MGKIQSYISKSLEGLDFRGKYGLADYTDIRERVILFGFYREEEYDILLRHEGEVIVIWQGMDSCHIPENIIPYLQRAKHISISKWVQERLNGVGITSELIVVTATRDIYEAQEHGESVYFYTNITSEDNNRYYGGDLIEEVKNKSGYNIITGWYGKFLKADMQEIYRGCFLNLRLTKMDGYPNTNMEMGLMGRMSVFNGGGACSLPYKNADDICFLIDSEYRNRSMDRSEFTRKTMLNFKNENEKRFKEFIGMSEMFIY